MVFFISRGSKEKSYDVSKLGGGGGGGGGAVLYPFITFQNF